MSTHNPVFEKGSQPVNAYIQRLSRTYLQLQHCRMVTDKLVTEATCAEFDAICNGCAPIGQEFIVVSTLRMVAKSDVNAFSSPDLQHFSVAACGPSLLNNLGINDIASLPYSGNGIFCRIAPLKMYPGGRGPRAEDSQPTADSYKPFASSRDPVKNYPKKSPRNLEAWLSLRDDSKAPPKRSQYREVYERPPAYKKQMHPNAGATKHVSYMDDEHSVGSHSVGSHVADSRESEKPVRIMKNPDAKVPSKKNAPQGNKRSDAPHAAEPKQPRKKAPSMLLDDFMQLRDDVISVNKSNVSDDVPAASDASSEAGNTEPAKEHISENQPDEKKSWADMAGE